MAYRQIPQLLSLNGVKIPFILFLVVSTIFIFAHIEDLLGNNLNYFNPNESVDQYVCAFIFIGFIIFFTNRINFIYLLSNQASTKGLIYKNIFIAILSIFYSLIYIGLYNIFFSLAGLDISIMESLSYLIRTLLFTFSSGLFFSFLLNLNNSYPTLFLLYFIPLIVKGILFLIFKFSSIDLRHVLPLSSTEVDSNLILVASILIFGILSNLTHKVYYFK